MNGKGSSTRPLSISREEFNKNWDMIFKKKSKEDLIKKQIEESKKNFDIKKL